MNRRRLLVSKARIATACAVWTLAMWQFGAGQILAGPSADTTLNRLAKVGLFAFGGVGFAGVTSQGEKDYREILARPSAKADFEKLFQTGDDAAKCYALVALYALDRVEFKELSHDFRNSDARIMTMRGCIILRQRVSAVIDGIEAGGYSH